MSWSKLSTESNYLMSVTGPELFLRRDVSLIDEENKALKKLQEEGKTLSEALDIVRALRESQEVPTQHSAVTKENRYVVIMDPPITQRTLNPELFFRNFNMNAESCELPCDSFNSSDIEQIYQLIDSHPTYEFCLLSLFELEFLKIFQAFQSLNCPITESFKMGMIKSWQKNFLEMSLCFSNQPIIFGEKVNFEINDFAKIFSKLFGLIEKNLISKEAVPQEIEAFLAKFKNIHDLFLKFLNHSSAHYLLHNTQVGECAGMNIRKLTLSDADFAAKEINNHIAFIFETLNSNKTSISSELMSNFQKIFKRSHLLNFDGKTSSVIYAQCCEIIQFLGQQFLSMHLLKDLPSTLMSKTDIQAMYRLLEWDHEMIKVLMQTVLPGIDRIYRNVYSYEDRILWNVKTIQKFITDFKRIEISKDDSSGLKKIKSTHDSLIYKMTKLNEDLSNLSKHQKVAKEYKLDQFPFIISQLKNLSDKLKPLIDDVLSEIFECIQNHSDELKNIPLSNMTEKIGVVLSLKYHVDLLLCRTKINENIFPLEYLLLVVLENSSETNSAEGEVESIPDEEMEFVLEEENDDEEMKAPPSSDQEDSSSALRSLSPRASITLDSSTTPLVLSDSPSVKKKASGSFTIFASPEAVVTLPEKKPKKSVELKSLYNVSLTHINRAYRKLGLHPENGGSHTKWVDAQGNVWTVAPRARKPGRGLQKAQNRQIERMAESLNSTQTNQPASLESKTAPEVINKKNKNKPKRR